MSQQHTRSILANAVRQAEQNILTLMKSGKAKLSGGPYDALTALAVHTGFVVEGGEVTLSMREIMALQQFIATDDEYVPSNAFPFTKQQMRRALEEQS